MSVRRSEQVIQLRLACSPPHQPGQVLELLNQAVNGRGELLRILQSVLTEDAGEVTVTLQVTIDSAISPKPQPSRALAGSGAPGSLETSDTPGWLQGGPEAADGKQAKAR